MMDAVPIRKAFLRAVGRRAAAVAQSAITCTRAIFRAVWLVWLVLFYGTSAVRAQANAAEAKR